MKIKISLPWFYCSPSSRGRFCGVCAPSQCISYTQVCDHSCRTLSVACCGFCISDWWGMWLDLSTVVLPWETEIYWFEIHLVNSQYSNIVLVDIVYRILIKIVLKTNLFKNSMISANAWLILSSGRRGKISLHSGHSHWTFVSQ